MGMGELFLGGVQAMLTRLPREDRMTRVSQGQADGPTMPLSVRFGPDSLCPKVTAEYWGLLQCLHFRSRERKANPQPQVRKCCTCRCPPGGFPLNHQILKSQLGGTRLVLVSGGTVGWGGRDTGVRMTAGLWVKYHWLFQYLPWKGSEVRCMLAV